VTAETGGMNFKGKVVVATGVGAGIGAAIADAFAASGATVVGLERDPETLRQTAMRIGAGGVSRNRR
jgi:NADP-dependent 3-hydroxy acid dehydrogenase YdfG